MSRKDKAMCYKKEVDLHRAKPLSGDPVIVISTMDEKGVSNVAAFGSYLRIGPTIILAISPDCHTYKNIIRSKEFVINVPGLKDMEFVMRASRAYAAGQDEIKAAGLKAESSLMVAPPTIRDFPASVECRLKWTKNEGSHDLVAADILCGRCDEAYLDPVGRFDQVKAGTLHIVRYPEPVYIVADRYIQGIERM